MNTYSLQVVLSGMDPTGLLWMEPDHPRIAERCGEAKEVKFAYHFHQRTPCQGYVIQKITFACRVEYCEGCPIPADPVNPNIPIAEQSGRIQVFEAFPVRANAWRISPRFRDRSVSRSIQDTIGAKLLSVEARFYCRDAQDGNTSFVGDLGQPKNDKVDVCFDTLSFGPYAMLKLPQQAKTAWETGTPVEKGGRWYAHAWRCCPKMRGKLNHKYDRYMFGYSTFPSGYKTVRNF